MPSLFTLSLLLAGVAAVPFEAGEADIFDAVKRQAMPSCNRDNCYRAAVGTAFPTRSGDCAAFLRKTVTPCPVILTSTLFRTVTTGTSTSTLSSLTATTTTTVTVTTTTSTQTDAATTVATFVETTTPTVTPTTTLPPPAKKKRADAASCEVTGSASAVPIYASACSGAARYSSACACGSFTAATTTLAPITTTTTITNVVNTMASAVTTTTTTQVIVVVITSTSSSATTTVATTVTTTTVTSTAPAVTAPAQEIENIDSCLRVTANVRNNPTNFGNSVYKYGARITLLRGNRFSAKYATFPGDQTACQAVQACADYTAGFGYREFNVYRQASDNAWQCIAILYDGLDGGYSTVDSNVKSSCGFRS